VICQRKLVGIKLTCKTKQWSFIWNIIGLRFDLVLAKFCYVCRNFFHTRISRIRGCCDKLPRVYRGGLKRPLVSRQSVLHSLFPLASFCPLALRASTSQNLCSLYVSYFNYPLPFYCFVLDDLSNNLLYGVTKQGVFLMGHLEKGIACR
jgi:hypothetical protein